MTAQEARNRALEVKARNISTEMSEVMEDIEVAVRDGKLMTYYYRSISPEAYSALTEAPNSFKIYEQTDSRDGNYYEIHW